MAANIKICSNDSVGRFAVASKDLQPGEEILRETPFSFGPKTGSCVLCLGCLKPVDATVKCTNCKWPVCNETCSNRLEHQGECLVFKNAKVAFQNVDDPTEPSPQYESITPLRTLLAMDNNRERWEREVAVMESHCEQRRGGDTWKADTVNVVNFLRDACGLKNKYAEELIHKVCGILEVNCYEALTEESFPIRGLYPQTGILSHSCVANTSHTILPSKGYTMILRTTIGVKSNEKLFSSYTGSIQPTMVRRQALKYSKYFECSCERCSDPSELGTHMSTLKCTKCDPGLIMSVNPLDDKALWKCSHCDFAVTGNGIKRILIEIKNDISNLEDLDFGPERLQVGESLLKKYKSVLHPNHAMNIEITHSLIPLYGRAEGYTFDLLPDILLERKIDLCRRLLKILDIIEPGLTRIRGLTLYEYHVVLLLLSRNRFQRNEINKDELKEQMEDVRKVLGEVVKILTLEPESTSEGMLGRQADYSLQELGASINELS